MIQETELESLQLKFLKYDQVLRIRKVCIPTLEWCLQTFRNNIFKDYKEMHFVSDEMNKLCLKKLMVLMNFDYSTFDLHTGRLASQE